MTQEEIAKELEKMVIEDGKRPPFEQVRELIERGVIDENGKVLIGFWNENERDRDAPKRNGKGKSRSKKSD